MEATVPFDVLWLWRSPHLWPDSAVSQVSSAAS